MNDVTTVIRARRSIRSYKSGMEIPQQDIDLMLEAAMMAPSAGNRRPWEFVVVKSMEKREEIMQAHEYSHMLREASLGIVVCALPETQTGNLEGFWPQDCGAAIENLLLQAAALGYGTVWCGVYPIQKRVEALRRILDVASVPMAVIAVGVPDEQPKARGFYDREKVKYL